MFSRFAALGARWVDYGVFSHFVFVPVADPGLSQAWFSLSFGIEQVYGLVDLEALNLAPISVSPEIEIREVGPGDRQGLAVISDIIWKFQLEAPIWAVWLPEYTDETEADWAGMVDEADVTVWLAVVEGKIAALQGYWPAQQTGDDPLIPENCVSLGIAGTREGVRGKGTGSLIAR